MKKYIIVGTCVAVVTGFVAITSISSADLNPLEKFVELREEANDEEVSEDVVVKGKNTEITEDEVADSAVFFEAQGEKEEEAIKSAETELMEYYALYAEAKNKGYSTTKEEVEEYVENLRKTVSTAENREEVEKVIEAYGDEDAYWDNMKERYMTRLVAEKYTHDLLAAFNETCKEQQGTDAYEKEWKKYFEGVKKKAVNKEKYKIVKDLD